VAHVGRTYTVEFIFLIFVSKFYKIIKINSIEINIFPKILHRADNLGDEKAQIL